MFTQTANRLGSRRGEEVSRLRVCLLQLPAHEKKKHRILFQSRTTAAQRREAWKDKEAHELRRKVPRREDEPSRASQVTWK